MRVFVSLDGLTYNEVKHSGRLTREESRLQFYQPGNVPGEIFLESSQVVKYVRLVMIEDQTDPDVDSKPIGVRFLEMVGCPGKDDLETCAENIPRLSTDGKAYRHIG